MFAVAGIEAVAWGGELENELRAAKLRTRAAARLEGEPQAQEIQNGIKMAPAILIPSLPRS
jgi:hypothetical protein